jgi:two-component system NarL family response regulator
MQPQPIRILIVDDHPALRAGLRALIASQPDMEVIAESGDGREGVEMFRLHRPDIVLMDLRLPRMSGVEAILAIRSESPAARIIVNTTYDTDEDIHRAIQSGAKSYLLKDMPQEEIFAVIRAVNSGHEILPTQVEQRLNERMRRPELTKREMAVIERLFKGRSNKEIADDLGISEDTVKFRLKGLFSKLGVSDRTAAVVAALRHGIVHME